jgi:hypothetical protein
MGGGLPGGGPGGGTPAACAPPRPSPRAAGSCGEGSVLSPSSPLPRSLAPALPPWLPRSIARLLPPPLPCPLACFLPRLPPHISHASDGRTWRWTMRACGMRQSGRRGICGKETREGWVVIAVLGVLAGSAQAGRRASFQGWARHRMHSDAFSRSSSRYLLSPNSHTSSVLNTCSLPSMRIRVVSYHAGTKRELIIEDSYFLCPVRSITLFFALAVRPREADLLCKIE